MSQLQFFCMEFPQRCACRDAIQSRLFLNNFSLGGGVVIENEQQRRAGGWGGAIGKYWGWGRGNEWGKIRFVNNNFMEAKHLTLEWAKSLSTFCRTANQELKMPKRTLPAQDGSDSQSFEPEYHQIKKLGFKINKKKICTGGWSSRENQTYLQFMLENTEDFLSEKARRKTKVFYRLSKILKKRTPDQCRSHHQKLQLKYKDDLVAIIGEVQRKIQTCFIQDYMSEQQRLHRQNFERLRDQQEKLQKQRRYKTLIDRGWFNVKSFGSCLKLTIDPRSVNEW